MKQGIRSLTCCPVALGVINLTRTVAAAVPRTAHGISVAALLLPAAGEAAGRGLLRAVAVASHAALLIAAAWIHLLGRKDSTDSDCQDVKLCITYIFWIYERSLN